MCRMIDKTSPFPRNLRQAGKIANHVLKQYCFRELAGRDLPKKDIAALVKRRDVHILWILIRRSISVVFWLERTGGADADIGGLLAGKFGELHAELFKM